MSSVKEKLEAKNVKTETTKPKSKATVTRTIDGVKREFTPAEHFKHQTNYRVTMIRAQLKHLAKQHGPNYEYTEEFIDNTETELLKLIDDALSVLRNPKAAKQDDYSFDCSK